MTRSYVDFSKLCIMGSLLVSVEVANAAPNSEGSAKSRAPGRVATIEEMIAARTDVWGDAAMRQPNGATYDFFKDLLPPLRWVNAEFHHYPIVLSAPRAAQKVRLISNGSAVNARG